MKSMYFKKQNNMYSSYFTSCPNKYVYLPKQVKEAIMCSPLMDVANVSNIVMEYDHPKVQIRYLYLVDVSVDFKDESEDERYDFHPIDYRLWLLALNPTEAAVVLESIVSQLPFFDRLDFSVEKILQYKERYVGVDEPLGFLQKSTKPFYTTSPVLLFHSETQISYDEIYRFKKRYKKMT